MPYKYNDKLISYEDGIKLNKAIKDVKKLKNGADVKLRRFVEKGIVSQEDYHAAVTTYYRLRAEKRNKKDRIISRIFDIIAVLFLVYIAVVIIRLILFINAFESDFEKWLECSTFVLWYVGSIKRLLDSRSGADEISALQEQNKYLREENEILRSKLKKVCRNKNYHDED